MIDNITTHYENDAEKILHLKKKHDLHANVCKRTFNHLHKLNTYMYISFDKSFHKETEYRTFAVSNM